MWTALKNLCAGLAIASLLASSPTQAGLPGAVAQHGMPEPIKFLMPLLGPFAYTHFCLRYAADCRVYRRALRRPHPMTLSADRMNELLSVNNAVNRSIAPKHYINDTSFDTWRIAPRSGDCNDYAVTKRHELLAKGWPSRTLLLSEVITPWGEHHLILLVRTDRGNYVLDNLHHQIQRWSSTGYQWVRVQMPDQPSLWATIKDPRPPALS